MDGGMTLISMSSVAGPVATAAAATRQHRNVEEELLTAYNDKELADGWEFKILRSASGAFKRPEQMREILEEEARAGWTLVEKFDSDRLRLKRPPEAGQNDRRLDFDAWRTQIGASQSTYETKIVLIGLGVVFAVLGIVACVGIAIFGAPG